MVLVNKAHEKSYLLHDRPKCFILLNFHSFSVISATSGHKKFHYSAIVRPMGLYLVSSCSSRDYASDTVPLNYSFIFNARSCMVSCVYYSDSHHVFACNTFKALFVMNILHGIHAFKVKVHACTIQARGVKYARKV